MIGRWIAAHRGVVATAVSGTVIAAVVATVAIVSTGYTAQRMDLDDGAVWVANGTRQVIGRANVELHELNTVVQGEGQDMRVVQDAQGVLLVDGSNASLDTIDTATSEVLDTIALPPEQPEVMLAGDIVVIAARGTGEAWILGRGDLQGFDPLAEPTLAYGAGADFALDGAGILWAYSAEAARVYRVDTAAASEADTSWAAELPDPSDDVRITAAGGRWAVLDRTTRQIATESGVADLTGLIPAAGEPQLQEPSADGGRVLVAHGEGLVSVPLDGAEPGPLAVGRSGSAAAPVRIGGCEYAGWSDGTAWRRCGGAETELSLSGMPPGALLDFQSRHGHVLLSDRRQGAAWAVQESGQLIDNWDELIEERQDEQDAEEDDEDTPPDLEERQQPPVAVDDEFGARPGKASILPVLLNDYDPNGDVLVIEEVTELDERTGRIDIVNQRQQLQIALEEAATGKVEFDYRISDGRGGSSTATVTVEVRAAEENSPPEQVRTTKTTVRAGDRVATQVLGDWVDPDGDAMYLASATSSEGGAATSKPGGEVVYTDGDDGSRLRDVVLAVSDGTATGTGGLAVTIRESGEVPIIAEPFAVQTSAGEEVQIAPLEHVRGGNGEVRLNAVPATTGVSVEPSFERGTFAFTSDQVRTHYLEYVVTDDEQTVTGIVRVDVSAPPDANARPITVPKTVFVTTLGDELVDVAATDIDPSGGVLVVTELQEPPAESGIRAELVEQRSVRVTLVGPVDEPYTLDYRVSNGLADAAGTITVVQIPPPVQQQAPIAEDDRINARVGDIIDIPVLDNDEQPDGFDITLLPELVEDVPEGGGLLFASRSRLRYLAPETAGNYTAVYAIEGTDGQRAEASVQISVRERNAATNSAPLPRTVTARAIAGSQILVDLPLAGIDPDGDAVQLLGQDSSPEKGSVIEVGADYLVYEAGAYSAGTDAFTYRVRDGLGLEATGTVRIGISPRAAGGRNPIAVDDVVTVRPGKTVSVQALQNDSDPDGGALRVDAVEPNDELVAAEIIDDEIVDITPPEAPGRYGLVYTISNEFGGQSSAYISVIVDPDAPLARPVARDAVLTVADVLDRTSIDVDVLADVFFADGSSLELDVGVLPGYGAGPEVQADKRIRVSVEEERQIIPFFVSNPEDEQLRAYAFIVVPGTADALPQLRPEVGKLSVRSEEPLVIDLDDYVVSLGSEGVQITDAATVRATHANGDDLVVDGDTLRYTSADQYFGPASIAFEVTDGTGPDDPEGRTAVLSLPIDVLPRENQPPLFLGASLEFEPGQSRELDLLRLTNYPYPDDLDELEFSPLAPLPEGFTYQLNGQRLVLTADPSTPKGSSTSMSLGVRDALSEGQAGRINLSVVASTRPLASPAPDVAVAKRGETTTIDVLANDRATNPFPGQPLEVVEVRGADGDSLPDGVRVTTSGDGSILRVQVSQNAAPADASLQYRVSDATRDPSRDVWGSVRISVQDRPDPVASVRTTEFGDRSLKVTWEPGSANNSPITEYRIRVTGADSGAQLSTTTCSGPASCSIATPGNGPSHAVRYSVAAVNSIGASDPVANTRAIWSDIIPGAPTGLSSTPLDQGLRVSWRKPAEAGSASPISFYVVTVGGVSSNVSVDPSDPAGTSYSRNIQAPSITNGSATSYAVSARNSAPNSLATWNEASSTGRPAGAPIAGATRPSASSEPESPTTVTLDWAGAFDSNGRSITNYYAVAYTDSAPGCTVSGVDSGDPVVSPPPADSRVKWTGAGEVRATFSGLTANQTYQMLVYAYNGQGCTATAPVSVTPRVPPGTVTSISTSGPSANGASTWDFTLDSYTAAPPSGDAGSLFRYRLIGEGVDQGSSGRPSQLGSRLVADSTHYGRNVAVQVKACAAYGDTVLCSTDWSQSFALGVPVRNDQLVGLAAIVTDPGGVVDRGRGEWRWDAGRVDNAYTAVTVSCDGGTTQVPLTSGPGTCDVRERALGGYPALTVTIRANGDSYVREYRWNDYD
ncbi:Ig-like domain-containing protein [Homoserinibacter sp. YIM 151385]|uniref:Ig-like domain-containing protein n=1 Tax=Homoserinibacter sp. YIM 151385 TaxID=2985506 RepID=UPI0022F0D6F4|nr:Ig-like domain-containing protein [Homoserinibacter sp. YIM 151385]WBU38308.1 Ig-like domain-containing protein [Homoserinibacter sp. YIM 151385]